MIDLSKVLTTGANGMMGSYIDFGITTDRDTLDITDPQSVEKAFVEHSPHAVIHLASYTDVEGSETDPQHAHMVNTIGTAYMAQAARKHGAKFIYVSTGGVFDGEKGSPYLPSDEPNPKTIYGKSKYFGELIVRGMLPDSIIARVCWVFGGGPSKDKKFFGKIAKQLLGEKKDVIRVTNDVIGSPTFAKEAVGRLKELMRKDATGIFHLANEGVATRCDVANQMLSSFGVSADIQPVDFQFFSPKAPMGRNESLASELPGHRPWQEALDEYVRTEWKGYIKSSI